jgi:hypothetical protein
MHGNIYARGIIKAAAALVIPLLTAGAALGGEGVQVNITNDGTQDIVVTVYDMNSHPKRAVLQNARINGFTSVPIFAIADAKGRANLAWTATSTDQTAAKCGHADTLGIGNDAAVNVHAESSCSA